MNHIISILLGIIVFFLIVYIIELRRIQAAINKLMGGSNPPDSPPVK